MCGEWVRLLGKSGRMKYHWGAGLKDWGGPLFAFQFIKHLKIFNQTLLYFTVQNKIIFWALFSLELHKPPWIISNYL